MEQPGSRDARQSRAGRASTGRNPWRRGTGPFRPNRLAEAYTEFVTYIESSDRTTARQLATRYDRGACELYKLGALWGYSTLVRAVLAGERAVFGPEIRHHAAAFGLPEPLYLPVTLRTPADRTGEQLAEESMTFTQAVTEHLSR